MDSKHISTPTTAEERIADALDLIKIGNYEEAIQFIDIALKIIVAENNPLKRREYFDRAGGAKWGFSEMRGKAKEFLWKGSSKAWIITVSFFVSYHFS